MKAAYLGIDTSCYTTSVAGVTSEGIASDIRAVLSVREGERGLRQSEGLFQHTKNLETSLAKLFSEISRQSVKGVCVSNAPRAAEGSYMPVFLAGKTVATAIASALGVPLLYASHQDGHVRAALYGNEALMNKPFLGLHISGGTTEVFHVDEQLKITLLGGTTDLHAGQFVDRVGVAMGLPFPCGKHLEALATGNSSDGIILPNSVNGLNCSFSGVETKVQQLILGNAPKASVANAVYECMAKTFDKLLYNAVCETGVKTVLIAGGVASSALLRTSLMAKLPQKGVAMHFGRSELSSDNAVGTALICMDRLGE